MTTAPEGVDRERGQSGDGGTSGASMLGRLQRPLTVAVGGGLLVRGLRKRSISGMALAATGGYLLYRGITDRPITGSGGSMPTIGTGTGPSGQAATAVERSVTVDLPAEELQEYWQKPEYLSEIMGEFAQVTPADGNRLHWRVEGPMGSDLSWETRFLEDEADDVVRWKTVQGAPIDSEWTVRYRDAPGEQGTEVTLRADFDPPGGRVGKAAIERVDFAVESVVATALNRFKSLAETGEIPTLEDNPSARGQGDLA